MKISKKILKRKPALAIRMAEKILDENGKSYKRRQGWKELAPKLEEMLDLDVPEPGSPNSSFKQRGLKALFLALDLNISSANDDGQISEYGKPQAKLNRFYRSFKWRQLRYKVLKHYGRECMCCGRTEGSMHVDHIKPLRFNWDLRLDWNNLQVLCNICNHGKGNWDETDFRSRQKIKRVRLRIVQ